MTDERNRMVIREGVDADLTQLRQLFRDTVLAIDQKYYTVPQLKAWASAWLNGERWRQKFRLQHFFVAEKDDHPVGFCSLSPSGYLDFLYVHRDYQRQGIASALLKAAESRANQNLIKLLNTDSSKSAYDFFIRHGFTVLTKQTIEVSGVSMENFAMQKKLV
jgi:putative acetyltransferase